ncbi:MAG: hypothetical protein CM1200mP10_25480 [Candidatus Neomarinimicrobiota bacterium]|nr:MAG: hypothetical protein CM1200mP10_25480 [Candidatus Neomarinimicrobiota bacterium]
MPIKYSWRLNERHYGALQGLNKAETAAKFGDEQVLIWRRSYDTNLQHWKYQINAGPGMILLMPIFIKRIFP